MKNGWDIDSELHHLQWLSSDDLCAAIIPRDEIICRKDYLDLPCNTTVKLVSKCTCACMPVTVAFCGHKSIFDISCWQCCISLWCWLVARSTLRKAGLKCPSVSPCVLMYVRPSVRPSTNSFLGFSEIWLVGEVDEWCMMVCSMTRSKVKVTSPSKLEIRPFSTAIFSTSYNGSW